jgi:hypothetical protein
LRKCKRATLAWPPHRPGVLPGGQANTGGISEAILWTPVRDGKGTQSFSFVFRLPPLFAPVLAGQAREAPCGLGVVPFVFKE